MIPELRPYRAYKDSGVKWLGPLPEHWRITRNKFVFRQKEIRAGSKGGTLLSLSRRHGLLPRHMASGRIASVEDLSAYRVCRPDDLVMNRMQAWSGMFAASAYDGVVSPDYCVFELAVPSETKFFEYLFKTPVLVLQFALRSKGIGSGFNRLYSDSFGAVPVPVPPVHEQTAIVRLLSYMDRRIRQYIRAKGKLIALLEEQKQSVINRAVTGRIHVRTGQPYAAYRESKATTSETIPAHWQECRLRNVVSIVTTGSRGWSSYAAEHGPLFIRVANLSRGSLALRFDDVVRLDLPTTTEAERARIRVGDILVSVTAYIGSVGIAPKELEEAYVSQHVARCRPVPGSCARWLGYVLLSRMGQTHGKLSLYGGTKDGLSLDDVKNYPIVLPPYEEQGTAVRWIEDQSKAIVNLRAITAREIALVREYGARLVADVVTGKVDVREAAAQLPDGDPVEIDDALEDTLSTDDRADLDIPRIQPNGLRT